MSVASEMVEALKQASAIDVNFNTVKHSWSDEDTLELKDSQLPAALPYPGDHVMQENTFDEFVANMVNEFYHVIMIVRHAELTARLSDVRAVLIGWQYPDNPAYDLMELVSGEVIQLAGDFIWWRETYQTRIQLRQAT